MRAWRLEWNGRSLEVEVRRAGLRTAATLVCDATSVAESSGLVRVLLPLPGPQDAGTPQVLVLAPLPGHASRVTLLVPREAEGDDGTPAIGDADLPDGAGAALILARAGRHPFDPPPGTFAARQRALQARHPRLWAARHVVLAVGRVLGALLGIAALLQLLVRPIVSWLAGLLPQVDWPDIPWPVIDLPSIPWPDLPDISPPGWLAALLATAKFWLPILIAVVVAAREVRKKTHGPAAGKVNAEGLPGGHEENAETDAHH